MTTRADEEDAIHEQRARYCSAPGRARIAEPLASNVRGAREGVTVRFCLS